MNEPTRITVIFSGHVQGVGFRYFVMERARELRLVGVCRNLRNGAVEVIAEGLRGELEALLVALSNGPRMSYVENVHAAWSPATGEFRTFSVASTR